MSAVALSYFSLLSVEEKKHFYEAGRMKTSEQ